MGKDLKGSKFHFQGLVLKLANSGKQKFLTTKHTKHTKKSTYFISCHFVCFVV
jgi:hypothetical protein